MLIAVCIYTNKYIFKWWQWKVFLENEVRFGFLVNGRWSEQLNISPVQVLHLLVGVSTLCKLHCEIWIYIFFLKKSLSILSWRSQCSAHGDWSTSLCLLIARMCAEHCTNWGWVCEAEERCLCAVCCQERKAVGEGGEMQTPTTTSCSEEIPKLKFLGEIFRSLFWVWILAGLQTSKNPSPVLWWLVYLCVSV